MRLHIVIAASALALGAVARPPHANAETSSPSAPTARSQPPRCPTGPNLQAGTVRFFNELKGFGFIVPAKGGEEVYVHHAALGTLTIKADDQVVYEVTSGKNGPVAANVRLCR
jgi:CspA family cold shock protein